MLQKLTTGKSGARLLLVLLFWAGVALSALAQAQVVRTEANVMVEVTFRASDVHGDPFNQVTLDVIFSNPQARELRVPAFWAGANVWKVRYASPLVGTHHFRSECSEAEDKGLHGITGTVEIQPYTGSNLLYAHGPLQVAPNRRYLEHIDHTPFFWLGDTWWMGLCHRLRWPEEFQQLAADRKEKGFNVIQIVAGLYPDMFPFDPRGANEAGYPWETNYARIRPEYFDAADQRLRYLVDQGFTPCIVGAWGYFMPWMGVEKLKAHWRYLIARYGALPVVWCAAGEANLPWYLAKGFPYDDRKQVADWTEILRFVRATDPFHRPLTIHPTAIKRYTARHATDDPSLLDFDMLQTPHGQSGAVPITVKAVRESYAATPVMPVIDGEASYEMLNDSLPTEWTRRMFWVCLMNGAAGHTYGANGIWQCNRVGQPHGASPGGGSGYGKIPWNEAMHLPGSLQVGLGKKLLEQYPWQRFQPHPEWASFSSESLLSLDNCQWIWFPEVNPAQDAPAAKRFFRRTFVLPEGKAVDRARLRVSADDWFAARLNSTVVGTGEDWHAGRQFGGLAPLLKGGTNILAIIAENKSATGANPAGLIACLEIRFADGESLKLDSDTTWRCAKDEVSGWDTASFNDGGWVKALAIGRYGDGPWGQIVPLTNDSYGPQAAGMPEVVRIIYVPQAEPIIVRDLRLHDVYSAKYFDPVSGAITRLAAVQADVAGLWTCPPPTAIDHDWVLILEAKVSGEKPP
jgi:hypothetical protein